jgi:uncharacterized DUF497 family protein
VSGFRVNYIAIRILARSEDRHVIIGMVNNRLLFVSYTMRVETIRIISARGAEPHERRQYHEDNV